MRLATTSLTELPDSGIRLDASYHASNGVKAIRLINEWRQKPGNDISTLSAICQPNGIFVPGRFRRIYVDDPEKGEEWLSPSDILKADLSFPKFISKKLTAGQEILKVKKDWILISRSGTIGNMVYVRSDMDGMIGSDDIIRVIVDKQQALPGYVYTFLVSSIGQALIEQKTYGAVVPHIEAHHIVDMPIPRLTPETEECIHALIDRAAVLRVESNNLIKKSQEQLFRSANLPNFSRREILNKGCWSFSYKGEEFGKHALTAWTYSPISRRMISDLKSIDHKPLGELVINNGIFYGGRFKRIEAYPGHGVELLNQANVFQLRPQGRWISRSSYKKIDEEMVSSNTILAAAQGTMGDNEIYGHCEFCHRNFEGKVISGHNVRIIPDVNKINPGYLYAFLSSDYGFHLLRNTSFGTKLLGFILDLVAKIPIPIFDKDTENLLGAKIYKAYDNRAEAILLEDEAQELLIKELGFSL